MPERGRHFIEEELITESGFRNPFPREDAIAQGFLSEGQLEALVKGRLLRVERHLGADRIELIHDLLTKVVRSFRAQERARRQSETAARIQAEKEESIRLTAKKRLETYTTLFGSLTLIAISICVFLLLENRRVDRELQERRRVERVYAFAVKLLEEKNNDLLDLFRKENKYFHGYHAFKNKEYEMAKADFQATIDHNRDVVPQSH